MAIQMTVPNMACSACGETIRHAVQAVDPTATVKTDPKTRVVEVEAEVSEDLIKRAIEEAGYTVT